jgi:NNP family nitrate/nitrite transporter-like MFS transporter
MIPGIFHAKALAKGLEGEEAAAYGRRLSGASMGLIGAVGALGGLGINLSLRQSFLSVGSGTGAFVAFLAFYGVCFLVTWAVYLRRPATAQTAEATASEAKPQLSYAEV